MMRRETAHKTNKTRIPFSFLPAWVRIPTSPLQPRQRNDWLLPVYPHMWRWSKLMFPIDDARSGRWRLFFLCAPKPTRTSRVKHEQYVPLSLTW